MTLPQLTGMEWAGVAGAAVVGGWVWWNHRDELSDLDLKDAIMTDGKLDLVKSLGSFGFLVMAYVILALLARDKLTEGYLTIFGAVCVGPVIAEIIKRGSK